MDLGQAKFDRTGSHLVLVGKREKTRAGVTGPVNISTKGEHLYSGRKRAKRRTTKGEGRRLAKLSYVVCMRLSVFSFCRERAHIERVGVREKRRFSIGILGISIERKRLLY